MKSMMRWRHMCGNGRCETLSILRKTPAERERERERRDAIEYAQCSAIKLIPCI